MTLFIATSADGMIVRDSGEIEWLVNSDIYDYDAFYAQVDTLLMGRKTFENIQKKGPSPYGGKKTFVFSKKLRLNGHPEIQVIYRDPAAFVEELKESEGGRRCTSLPFAAAFNILGIERIKGAAQRNVARPLRP